MIRRRMTQQYVIASILFACCVFASSAVQAQTIEPIDTQRFRPAGTYDGFIIQEGSSVRYPTDPWSMGAWLSYGHRPFIIADADNKVLTDIVGTQVGGNITGSYAFSESFELGVDLPFALLLSGEDLSGGAMGDIRFLPKINFYDDRSDGIGVGLMLELRAPTHSGDFYGGATNAVFAPRLLIDHRFGTSGFRLGGNVGVLLQEETQYLNVVAGHSLTLGLGAAYRGRAGYSPVEFLLDFQNGIGLNESDSEEIALEGFGAVRWFINLDWSLTGGLGVGMLEGYGVPTMRGLVGLRWEPSPNDPDHDNLPTDPPDGEERYGEGEDDGKDGDKDGKKGKDKDKDDGKDEAEKAREDAAERGYDACPDLAEDHDGIEDDDGCPEGDEDGDGVLDVFDECPEEAEVINGFEDDDGCPDEGPANIIVDGDRIKVLKTIRFKPNSDELEDDSKPLLEQMTLILRKRKDIRRVRIEGHTDHTGSRENNIRLSEKRAQVVKRYLTERGIRSSRLETKGYGPDKPLDKSKSEEAKTINRRVEFVIIKR